MISKDLATISKDSRLKILIINPFGIGDCLFTTPVIRKIKKTYPESFIGYWCNERVEEILNNNPRIDKIFPLSRGDIKRISRLSSLKGLSRSFKLFFAIKKEKFDIALDFSLDHRYGLVAKLSGIPKRIGFDYKKRGRFLTQKIEITGYSAKHAVEYYCDLLNFIAVKPDTCKLELFVPENAKISARKIFADCGIDERALVVGIAPGAGASWGQDAAIKHWPALKFAELADKIVNDFSAKILILGDKSEQALAKAIKINMHSEVIDLSGQTGLGDLAAIINSLDLLISNDGGPLHMAVALNKKTVSFFGPVDPKVYGPYPPDSSRHIVLKKELDCAPCYKNFRLSRCQRNKECLEKIDVQEAFQAVSVLLTNVKNS